MVGMQPVPHVVGLKVPWVEVFPLATTPAGSRLVVADGRAMNCPVSEMRVRLPGMEMWTEPAKSIRLPSRVAEAKPLLLIVSVPMKVKPLGVAGRVAVRAAAVCG